MESNRLYEIYDPETNSWYRLSTPQRFALRVAFPHFSDWLLTKPKSGDTIQVGKTVVRKV